MSNHFDRLSHVSLFNEYGPTECTVWCSAKRFEASDVGSKVSIGRPIQGAKIYCTGVEGNLLPIHTPGELLIGGSGLARGYLKRPDLTAERFVPDPFGAEGARLFKTGDRGRYEEDGCIDFLGRYDDQIKLRGYRIEPREIETALGSHPAVNDVAVVSHEDGAGIGHLIAFVAAVGGASIEEAELKKHVARTLPDFMVPERFVNLPRLPRLPNGKIDRSALPAFESLSVKASGCEKTPLSQVELLLAEIWQEVLAVQKIDRRDNFFDLGGNSLSAMQVTSRVQQLFLVEVPVTIVFDTANLEEFARELERLVGESGATSENYESLLSEIESLSTPASAAMRAITREGSRDV